jgi:hypothetical protein
MYWKKLLREKEVDQSRITVAIIPYKDMTSSKRVKRDMLPIEIDVVPDRMYDEPTEKSSIEWLESGLKSRAHEKRGWLRDNLLKYNFMEACISTI